MNQPRHFLLRGSAISRCLLLLVFAVLMSRALLSSVVMLDADAPAGSFGLTMCSGHGPMFPHPADRPAGMQMSDGMKMAMPGMASPFTSEREHARRSALGEQSESNGLCPFSAAFLTATMVTAFCAFFLFMMTVGRSWTPIQLIVFTAMWSYERPRTRAPPVLAR